MDITLYIILTWFVITHFTTVLPRIDLVKNLIIYMLLLIFTVSMSTVLYLNLGLVSFTEDKVKFIAVVLYRNIVTPLLLVIFSNVFNQLKTYTKKITSIILILLFTSLLELINLQLHLYIFVKWNLMMCLLLYAFYTFIAIMLNKGLHAFQKSGELNK